MTGGSDDGSSREHSRARPRPKGGHVKLRTLLASFAIVIFTTGVAFAATSFQVKPGEFDPAKTFLVSRCGGGDHVLEAVKRCWASLWTARALGYRARQGIRPEDVALAVVVQQLVPADVAGILFTANPMTGARDELMINAAWGLGEAIVGGHEVDGRRRGIPGDPRPGPPAPAGRAAGGRGRRAPAASPGTRPRVRAPSACSDTSAPAARKRAAARARDRRDARCAGLFRAHACDV